MKLEYDFEFPRVEEVDLYAAGGSVRDMILGKKPKDLDFVMVTELGIDQIVDDLKYQGAKIYQVKPEFGTVLTRYKGLNMDFTYARTDGLYSDGRRPDNVSIVDNIKEDSTRRDFTINAMYLNENGEVFDFNNGLEDLKNRVIRAVGDPDKRFKEDALRILRAVRFSVTLDAIIAHETRDSMRNNRELLLQDSIVTDRIKSEINKALSADSLKTIKCLESLGLLDILERKDDKFRFELVNRS